MLHAAAAKAISVVLEEQDAAAQMALRIVDMTAKHLVHAQYDGREREGALGGERRLFQCRNEPVDARAVVLVRNLSPIVRITRCWGGAAAKISRRECEDGVKEHRAGHGEMGNRDGEMVEWVIKIKLTVISTRV